MEEEEEEGREGLETGSVVEGNEDTAWEEGYKFTSLKNTHMCNQLHRIAHMLHVSWSLFLPWEKKCLVRKKKESYGLKALL